MLKFFHNKILISVQVFFTAICLVYIVKSEFFMEKMCPSLFWEKKIIGYENNLNLSQFKLDELHLKLDKESELLRYTIETSKKRAKAFGEDELLLINKATKEYDKKVAEIFEELKYFKNNMEQAEQLLTLAKLKSQEF